jgi:hypothetical protein
LNILGKVHNQTREVITGTAQDDIIYPMGGWDFVDGGAGFDTVVYIGTLEQYTLKKLSARFLVSESTGSDDTDYLTSIERLQFSNAKLALDLDEHAGDAFKIIGNLLGPKFIEGKPLVGAVLGLLDQYYTKTQIASLGLSTSLYQSLTGSSSNEDLVKYLFNNVVGRTPKPDELNTYLNMLSQGSTQAELAVLAGDSELNAMRINLVGLVQHDTAYL